MASCEFLHEGKWVTEEQLQEIFKNIADGTFQQKEGTESSKASPKTIAAVKEFLHRAGIKYEQLSQIKDKNGTSIGANGVANIIEGLVQVVNGKEATTLPEEASHVAVDIIEQQNPKLFKAMLSEISKYNTYQDTVNAYRDVYITPDGKPDIYKIKKEAIGKVLAEQIIKTVEGSTEKPELLLKTQSWWDQIVNFLKSIFQKADFNPFQEAADRVLDDQADNSFDKSKTGTYYQTAANKQQSIIDKIKEIGKLITKKQADPKDIDISDDNESNNWYEVNGKKVLNRVTDRTKTWSERRFGKPDFTDAQKKLYEQYRNDGLAGHADMEKNIFFKYIDPATGLARPKALDFKGTPFIGNQAAFDNLDNYFRELIAQYDLTTTRFFTEVMLYDGSYKKGEGEAGTVDLLIIDKDGKADIFDWKFQSIKDGNTDVPWYKQETYDIQLGAYKQILQKVYGVKEFGKTRAIPVLLDYAYVDRNKKDQLALKGIAIGTVDPKLTQDLRLTPVATKDEKTGNTIIDNMLTKLRAQYDIISKKEVKDHRKDLKAEQLNTIFTAIRQLQIRQEAKPIVEQVEIMKKNSNRLLDIYKNTFEGKESKDFTTEQISDFSADLKDASEAIQVYANIDIDLDKIIDKSTPEGKQLSDELTESSRIARDNVRLLQETYMAFGAKFIGERNGILNLDKAEKIWQGFTKNLRTLSQAPNAALQVLYRLTSMAKNKAEITAKTQNETVVSLKDKFEQWAKGKGLDARHMFDILKQRDKNGKAIHKLVDELDRKLNDSFKDAKIAKNEDFFKQNIDMDQYRQKARDYIATREKQIDENIYPGDDAKVLAIKKAEKARIRKEYDIDDSSFNGWGNHLMRQSVIKEKWYSKEFNELRKPENAPAMAVYNYIRQQNDLAVKEGYLDAKVARTFLPFIKSDLADKITFGADLNLGQSFVNNFVVNDTDTSFGYRNILTGEKEDSLAKRYTTDISNKVVNADGSITRDYSNVSQNLFQNLVMYNNSLYRYKFMSEIEDQVKLVQMIEENKSHLETTTFDTIIKENGIPKELPNNNENAKTFEEFMKAALYEQAYSGDSMDSSLGKLSAEFTKKVNKFFGKEIFPENGQDQHFSLVKTIDTLNRGFQMKTMGLNLLSSISNVLGANAQAILNAGKFFKGTDFFKAEATLTSNMFKGEEGKKLVGLLNYFNPLTEDASAHLVKKAGISKLTQANMSDYLMILMKYPDEFVQKASFLALAENSMIVNGEIININQYVKSKQAYKDRYTLSIPERVKVENAANEEIKKLKEEQSLVKVAQVDKDGNITLPGIAANTADTALRFRMLSQNISKRMLGNTTKDDMNLASRNIFLKSMMMFKNWIPRMVTNRFEGMRYDAAIDDYEWGRFRTFGSVLMSRGHFAIGALRDALVMNEKGVENIKKLYLQKKAEYEESTGKEFTMKESEFLDMVKMNVRNQINELYAVVALTGIFLASGKLAPDKDDQDKEKKNAYAYYLRLVDKVKDELSFYYNPINFQQILNGSIFPSMGLLTDLTKVFTNLGSEIFGLATHDEDMQKSAHPVKATMKVLPVFKEMTNYLAIFWPDVAKDLGITVSKQSRMK